MTELRHHTFLERGFNRKRLLYAIIITFITMLIEIIGGIYSHSLSLLSDATHMFSHLFALSISYVAILLSLRPADGKKTYGYYRAEILAAFINGVTLFIIVGAILYGAYERFKSPLDIRSGEMLIVALLGLVVNVVTALLLKAGSKEDLNIKSAFLHAMGDMISSVGVVAGAIVIYYTQINIIDTIVSVIIALVIIYWAIRLIKDSTNILLEGMPKDLDVKKVIKTLKDIIIENCFIHHVHAWQIGTKIYALTVHISADIKDQEYVTELIKRISVDLKEKYNILHATVQFEYATKEKVRKYQEALGNPPCTKNQE